MSYRSAEPPRLLVAVDLAEASQGLVEEAACLAQRLGASLDLVHVLPERAAPADREIPGAEEREVREARAELETLALVALGAGVPASVTVVRSRDVAGAIQEAAESGGHDLIVLGSRGRTPFTRWMLGSGVIDRLRHASHRPVLIVAAGRSTYAAGEALTRFGPVAG